MLVLSRKAQERIVLNPGPDQIVLTVVDIDRGKIRLGIQAPDSIKIMREELLTAAQRAELPPHERR